MQQSKHRKAITASLIVFIVVVGIFVYWLVRENHPIKEEQPKIDIQKEIEILNNELELGFWNITITQGDWKVFKKQMDAIDATFVRMDTWNDFKESLKQNIWMFGQALMQDESRRVIWFVSLTDLIIYYQY